MARPVRADRISFDSSPRLFAALRDSGPTRALTRARTNRYHGPPHRFLSSPVPPKGTHDRLILPLSSRTTDISQLASNYRDPSLEINNNGL